MLFPTHGNSACGVRSSNEFTNTALPPIGKPVVRSRGPAWFRAKPRCEFPPPPKNRSGSGIGFTPEIELVGSFGLITDSVPPKGSSTPMRVLRAKTHDVHVPA